MKEEMDRLWALEQASKYAQKYAETKNELTRLAEQLKALQEVCEQAQLEIKYLTKLNKTQQRYIDKLEENALSNESTETKETTILTIHHLQVVKDDAC